MNGRQEPRRGMTEAMKNTLSILLLFLLLQGGAFARSSGRSYSSGSSHSSSGRSYSTGSQFSSFGKSYSSSSSHPFSSTGSSSPKSYSSAGSSNPKSFSNPSASKSQSFGMSSPGPAAKSNSSGGSPFGRSYSSAGGNSFLGRSAAVSKGNFNSGLTSAGQQEDSRIAFEKHYSTPAATSKSYMPSNTPAATSKTYTPSSTPAGTSRTYTPSDYVKVERIRSVDESRYRNYDDRALVFYGNSRPANYNDYWSPFLNGYLLSSAINRTDRAAWVYHHRDSIDDARYQDLVTRDAGLAAQLEQMKLQNVQRDPGYVLPTMASDPDLMYSKGFVDSARRHGPPVWSVAIWTLVVVVLVGMAVWLLFIREWQPKGDQGVGPER